MLTTDNNTNIALIISYGAYLLLLVIVTIDSLNAGDKFLLVWLMQLIPLLLLLPGLLAKYYRSFSWLCFLMLAYFTGYVVQTYSSTGDVYDWIGLSLSIVIFITAMFASRWLQRLQKQIPPS